MSRSFREIYQALREEINIPPKKLGPGTGQSGQHPVGNQTVQSKTPEQFHSDYKNNTAARVTASSAVDRVKRGVGPDEKPIPREAPKPAPKTDSVAYNPRFDTRPTDKRPAGTPYGNNTTASKPNSKQQLRPDVKRPRNPANFPGDANGTKPSTGPTNWPGGRPQPGTFSDKINKASQASPGSGIRPARAEPPKPATADIRDNQSGASRGPKTFQFTDAERSGKVSAARLKQWQDSQGEGGSKLGLGNFLNSAKGKTAVAGGKNDKTAAQKSFNIKNRNLDRSK